MFLALSPDAWHRSRTEQIAFHAASIERLTGQSKWLTAQAGRGLSALLSTWIQAATARTYASQTCMAWLVRPLRAADRGLRGAAIEPAEGKYGVARCGTVVQGTVQDCSQRSVVCFAAFHTYRILYTSRIVASTDSVGWRVHRGWAA